MAKGRIVKEKMALMQSGMVRAGSRLVCMLGEYREHGGRTYRGAIKDSHCAALPRQSDSMLLKPGPVSGICHLGGGGSHSR